MIVQDLFEAPQLCPECGGVSFSDLILAEKKDACYYKVKASAKVWPSAYASGRLVQCRKKGADNYGNSKNEGVAEGNELAQEFDLIESIIDRLAEHNGVDAELIWEDLESLTDDELYVFAVTTPLMEDWQKANKRDKTDGMSRKAVNAYRRENPGSKLKTAVTTKPSKLKRGSKASKRRKSYCSRSRGQMKMHSISCAKTPDKAICKARRRWNCESVDLGQGVAEGLPQTLRKVVPGHAKREIDKKMDAGKFGKTDADKDANFQRYKKIQDKIKEQGVAEAQLDEILPALAAGAGALARGGAAVGRMAGQALRRVPGAVEKVAIQGLEALNANVPGGIFNPDGSLKGTQILAKYLSPQQIQQIHQHQTQGVAEAQLDEINWKKAAATGALALGAMGGLGASDSAQARVSIGADGQMTPSFAQRMAQQGFQTSAEKPGGQMPNQNLDSAEKVERGDNGIIVHYDGKEYKGVLVPKDGPTPRGAKMIRIAQAQMGERGIGSYTAYLMPNGTAFIYKLAGQSANEGVAQGDNEKIGGRYDPDKFDSMVQRLKKLAGAGPMKTVYDPQRRVYRNVPVAQQPDKK